MPKKVVFCDFDGPIVDVSERYYRTYCKGLLAIEQWHRQQSGQRSGQRSGVYLDLQPLAKDQFWQMKQNRVADLEIAVRSGLPPDLFDPFMQQVERLVNHPSLLRWDQLQPEAKAALRYFKHCDLRLVLVTLRHPRQVQDFLQANGIAHLIDEIHGASDKKAAYANRVEQKRDLLIAAIAQQQAQGHLTQNSWMIGDTEADVLAGQAVGLSTAALLCGVRSQAYLQQLSPTATHRCLLTAAHKIVKAAALQVA
jgi:phosphoglycolate phosphatase